MGIFFPYYAWPWKASVWMLQTGYHLIKLNSHKACHQCPSSSPSVFCYLIVPNSELCIQAVLHKCLCDQQAKAPVCGYLYFLGHTNILFVGQGNYKYITWSPVKTASPSVSNDASVLHQPHVRFTRLIRNDCCLLGIYTVGRNAHTCQQEAQQAEMLNCPPVLSLLKPCPQRKACLVFAQRLHMVVLHTLATLPGPGLEI